MVSAEGILILSPFAQGIAAAHFLRNIFPQQVDTLQLAIISDGAIGVAAGYLLTGKTDSLRIYDTHPESDKKEKGFDKLQRVKKSNSPYVVELIERGKSCGSEIPIMVEHVAKNELSNLRDCNAIMIAEPVASYGDVVAKLKDYFVNGQTILLVNAPLGAGLEFNHRLREANLDHQLNILELGTLFDCASLQNNVLKVFGARRKVSICGCSRNETRRALAVTSTLSKSLVPSSNVLERGFAELERIIRPVLLLFSLLGGSTNEFSDLSHVINPSLMLIVRGLEAEVQTICKEYRLTARGFLETLTELSAVHWEEADCLEQALITVGPTLLAQIRMEAPGASDICKKKALEVLTKDVTETLTLIEDFGRIARIHTPVLDSIINLTNVIARTDLRKSGRNLGSLGLFGHDVSEITEMVNS
jgi:opine dehydrogenase